jgi:hypothetical protein
LLLLLPVDGRLRSFFWTTAAVVVAVGFRRDPDPTAAAFCGGGDTRGDGGVLVRCWLEDLLVLAMDNTVASVVHRVVVAV